MCRKMSTTQVANENINAESASIDFNKAQSLGEKTGTRKPSIGLVAVFFNLFVILAFRNTSVLSGLLTSAQIFLQMVPVLFWQVLLLLNFGLRLSACTGAHKSFV